MHFTTLTTLATILLAATTSTALPSSTGGAIPTDIETTTLNTTTDPFTDPPAHPLTKRQYAYKKVRYCEHANGGGRCVEQAFRHGLCYNLDAWWNDRVSSVYVVERNWRCRLHLDRDCRGGSRDVGPNWSVADLRTIGWNDRMSSIDCFGQQF
ncbi:beta and gamma crystallin [Diplodia corticola]|uniref:Beta and gamma crystallin n=1 Tax=Diplodia corticola TaxID=236234 RepID=A0A1J9QWR8_9PEZI|nr:beta and gamma crystallin [Diplodia corticola]OJD32833.1 beta and gamma crystallin [Diplodia corticola]